MRASKYLLTTQREAPADAEIISHKLMLRGGLIKQHSSGLYSWLPLGLRVFRKIESIIRAEMNKAGAIELSMPLVQPAELWQESQRWSKFGPELLRLTDRHQRNFCLGPTHEEIITDIARNEIRSYRQLPINLYQIQTKFRDEIRPRFGVMRTREFCMKDAYSFHLDQNSLQQTYEIMFDTYEKILSRIGLKFRSVIADTGSIGGSHSHEFHVIADSGEDAIAFSDESGYSANIEKAEAIAPKAEIIKNPPLLAEINTPGVKTIEQLCEFLDACKTSVVKTLLLRSEKENGDKKLSAIVLRGDHQLNLLKAEKVLQSHGDLALATKAQIEEFIGCSAGSLGPVDLNIDLFVDHSAAALGSFVCGANKEDLHLTGVCWDRDCPPFKVADLRNVINGDPSPDGVGKLKIARGIEVGHIFQLGKKYSSLMRATVSNEAGQETPMYMGCYGIGVGRLAAASIEQNHDNNGIIWPESIAPFQIAIIPINLHKSATVKECSENMYKELMLAGYDVLFMDLEKMRLGNMLSDVELIGIPHRLVIGERGLNNGQVEYRHRSRDDNEPLAIGTVLSFIKQQVNRHSPPLHL
ncbi:MAG: proline--tRNA ligase [Cellvibrionales bacterium TMED49]|nr:proline--tRNA ligase [Porticoccaceae bacterium]OUU35565.1 MAG: proline--tRNA ligase [Cellvibrionales bacterium TMED49]